MGYFARIARQSGVRYADHRASDRVPRKTRHDALAPIDVHEIVMVPATLAEPAASSPPEIRQNAVPADSTQARTPQVPDVAGAGPPSRVMTGAADPDVPPVIVAGARFTMRPPEERPADTSARFPRRSAVEQPGREAPPAITRTAAVRKTQESKVPEREADASREVSPVRSETPPTAHFFTRTAEMIAAPAADPIEMQTVVLREVREWIAAGSEPPGELAEEGVEPVPERVEFREAVPEVVLEPGVARIGARRRPRVDASPETPARIEEQTLELSIGTISVVIEGEDAPRQPPRNPAQPQVERSAGQVTRRQGSRLSRHYL